MDSSGIAVLLQMVKEATTVVIRDPSPAAKLVIEATGLSGVLPLEP